MSTSIPVPTLLVTIDSKSTRDVDDAIWVGSRAEGGFDAIVAIADPTALVPVGSPEDSAARAQGATEYAVDRAVRKMLPAHIGEAQGSLIAGERRRAFVFHLALSPAGEVLTFQAARSEVIIGQRLSYDDIAGVLKDQHHPASGPVRLAAALAGLLQAKRRKQGGLALYDAERLVYTDEEGYLRHVSPGDSVFGHLIVQELMILTNTHLARYTVDNEIPSLYRNHVAKPAAPSGDQLVATLQTWVESTELDAAKAESVFLSMIGRAFYAPTVTGHYGVGEPCYTHGTSPLRRYADLVTLRQVGAFLDGTPFPYTQQQLVELGEHLTQKAIERSEERSERFRAAVRRKAVSAMERGQVDHLDDAEVSQAVKVAAAAGALPPALVDDLVRRFVDGSISERIIDRMLTDIPEGLWTANLLTAVAGWLHAAPTRAAHLVNHGIQTGWLSVGRVSSTEAGLTFHGHAELKTASGKSATATATGSRKRDAEQAACVRAVCQLVGARAALDAVQGSANKETREARANPKGMLNELCQRQGWPAPSFQSTGAGPSHAMLFTCDAELVVAGERFHARSDGAANKKDAEAQAADRLLDALPARLRGKAKQVAAPVNAPSKAAQASPAAQAPTNAVGALQEAAQQQHWAMPAYQVHTLPGHPPTFRAEVTVAGPVAGRYTGDGRSKQEAKTRAAQAALSA